MKKLFAIVLTACMLASVLCITAFAATEEQAPAPGVVLRLRTQKGNDTPVLVQDYTSFEEGWNAAVSLTVGARDRVIVDLYADWNANDEGEFGDSSGRGFQFSTIYVPDDLKITLNLNGHTIDRDLEEWEYDGEVIYIDEDADVIINDGTVTGGFSCNGAGGIHIHDADVVLNNVHVTGNKVDDDNGAGIALYDDAVLTMNGGSIANNSIGLTGKSETIGGGGLYVEDSTANLTNVLFKNNHFFRSSQNGVAIFAHDGDVTIDTCTFTENGFRDTNSGLTGADSIFEFRAGSRIEIKNSTFTNNGLQKTADKTPPMLFMVDRSEFFMENCTVSGNKSCQLIYTQGETVVSNSTFVDNIGNTFADYSGDTATFHKCTFNNNTVTSKKNPYSFYFYYSSSELTFIDCEMGESTYEDMNLVKFVSTGAAPGSSVGSIFGAGSLAMIVALLSLVVSVVAVWLAVSYNKQRAALATANGSAETADGE